MSPLFETPQFKALNAYFDQHDLANEIARIVIASTVSPFDTNDHDAVKEKVRTMIETQYAEAVPLIIAYEKVDPAYADATASDEALWERALDGLLAGAELALIEAQMRAIFGASFNERSTEDMLPKPTIH